MKGSVMTNLIGRLARGYYYVDADDWHEIEGEIVAVSSSEGGYELYLWILDEGKARRCPIEHATVFPRDYVRALR